MELAGTAPPGLMAPVHRTAPGGVIGQRARRSDRVHSRSRRRDRAPVHPERHTPVSTAEPTDGVELTEESSGGDAARVRLFVIRHGQTRLNADGRLRGRLDEPLDVVGRHQARALADLFAGVALQRIVTSPLARARETAEPLARATGAVLETAVGLSDRDWGPWTGMSASDVEVEFGSLDRAPGVEALDGFARRVVMAACDVLDRANVETLAIVAHDAVNRVMLARLAENTSDDPQRIPQRCGCWSVIERHGEHLLATVIDARPGDGTEP